MSYRRDSRSNALILNVDQHTQEHTNNVFLMKKFPDVVSKLFEQNRKFKEEVRQMKEFPSEVAQLRRMMEQNSRSTMETQRQMGGPNLSEEIRKLTEQNAALTVEIAEIKITVGQLLSKSKKGKENGKPANEG